MLFQMADGAGEREKARRFYTRGTQFRQTIAQATYHLDVANAGCPKENCPARTMRDARARDCDSPKGVS